MVIYRSSSFLYSKADTSIRISTVAFITTARVMCVWDLNPWPRCWRHRVLQLNYIGFLYIVYICNRIFVIVYSNGKDHNWSCPHLRGVSFLCELNDASTKPCFLKHTQTRCKYRLYCLLDKISNYSLFFIVG